MINDKKGFLARNVKIIVVFAVLAGSTSGIFGSVIEAPAMAIGFLRLTMCLPFFAVPVLTKHRDALKHIAKKDYLWTFIAGAFLCGHFITWFNAVKMTNIASAAVLAALHPLVVLLITVFIFKRKVGIRAIMGITLALLGGVLIAGFDYKEISTGNFKGDILAFLAAVCMGIYFTIGEEVRKKVSGSVYVFLVFAACWICFAIGMVATGTSIFGYTTMDYVYIIGLTLVCQIGAHAVFNLCFGHVDSLYVSTWESGESVFAILMSVVLLGQTPTSWELMGSAVVVIGLLYYNYNTGLAAKARIEEDANELQG